MNIYWLFLGFHLDLYQAVSEWAHHHCESLHERQRVAEVSYVLRFWWRWGQWLELSFVAVPHCSLWCSGWSINIHVFIGHATVRSPDELIKLGWSDQAASLLRCSMTFSFFICPWCFLLTNSPLIAENKDTHRESCCKLSLLVVCFSEVMSLWSEEDPYFLWDGPPWWISLIIAIHNYATMSFELFTEIH